LTSSSSSRVSCAIRSTCCIGLHRGFAGRSRVGSPASRLSPGNGHAEKPPAGGQ
jgi:hypothetical protein